MSEREPKYRCKYEFLFKNPPLKRLTRLQGRFWGPWQMADMSGLRAADGRWKTAVRWNKRTRRERFIEISDGRQLAVFNKVWLRDKLAWYWWRLIYRKPLDNPQGDVQSS